jgi:hypothetical protein
VSGFSGAGSGYLIVPYTKFYKFGLSLTGTYKNKFSLFSISLLSMAFVNYIPESLLLEYIPILGLKCFYIKKMTLLIS